MICLFALLFVLYVRAEKQIDRANEQRFSSYLLADELRQSSDDLTRMVRSYVVTANPIYKQHYQEILAIRDGKIPRPQAYHEIYWDFVLNDEQRPRPSSGKAIALLQLMHEADFTEQEFAKLAEAKSKSDALTDTEFAAMVLLESSSTTDTTARLTASMMLHDANYHQAKYDIMRPLNEFYQLMEQRTQRAVETKTQAAFAMRIAVIITGVLLILTLWRAYHIMHTTLGATIDELYRRIKHIGSGNFNPETASRNYPSNSVMAWLEETRSNLATLASEHQKAETRSVRLTKLYAALSQCNQAIVRSQNQDDLFSQLCYSAVTFGGMKMAWIGILNGKQIKPTAWYGEGTEYLTDINISIDPDLASGRGPTGTAMREDCSYWCQDFINDPCTVPWQARAKYFGWGASASLPLHAKGKVIGAFTFYASEKHAFDEEARALLEEMAMDIDFAMALVHKSSNSLN